MSAKIYRTRPFDHEKKTLKDEVAMAKSKVSAARICLIRNNLDKNAPFILRPYGILPGSAQLTEPRGYTVHYVKPKTFQVNIHKFENQNFEFDSSDTIMVGYIDVLDDFSHRHGYGGWD